MKYILFLLFVPSLAISQDASDIVKWQQETIDLGIVQKGDKVANTFEFTNITTQDVEIDIVNTCDCTEAKWPTYPIEPGASAQIQFVFDSSQKDEEEPIEIDVYFVNTNPQNGNPYSTFLSYTFRWKD